MEKAEDVEAKANLQPLFYIRKIDSGCPKSYCLLTKKDKEDTYRELRNETSKDKNKVKSHTPTFANQPLTQTPKKNKCNCWRRHLATKVNATEVVKKDKDKAKDLSHIKCYTYK